MNYKEELIDKVLLLSLQGDLIGGEDTNAILERVQHYIEQDVTKCVVDISEVRYINSSGIGLLITILTKVRNKEGELILINPSEQVKKLLIITKLNAIFSILTTREEAIKRLAIA